MSKVLIIEDEVAIADLEKDYLELSGFEVEIENSGDVGLEKALQEEFDMYILDLMLPGADGFEICRQIREVKNTPILMVSAKKDDIDKIRGLGLGADDYITKPFNYQLLKLRIDKFIELSERNHRMFRNHIKVEPSEITITSLDEKLVEKAIRIVEEHMEDTEFSVETLSQELALSRGYLYKKLMAITGKGPADFIRTIRLKRARQLLANSQMQIAEVAYKCGFNSPKRFAQNFRNEFGMLPSEFLKGLP